MIHAMHEFVDRIGQAFFVAATMLPFGFQADEDKNDVMFLKNLFAIFLNHIDLLANDKKNIEYTSNKHIHIGANLKAFIIEEKCNNTYEHGNSETIIRSCVSSW